MYNKNYFFLYFSVFYDKYYLKKKIQDCPFVKLKNIIKNYIFKRNI
jgi:hypothetical protein